MNRDPFSWRPADLAQAQALVTAIEQRLAATGVKHRPSPPVPEACCGRGCHGCVWEGYYQALGYWQEDARELLGI